MIVMIAQSVVTFKFFMQTRKIEEIGWLPKLMIIAANIPGIILTAVLTYRYIMHEDVEAYIILPANILYLFPIFVNLALWVRFSRVQV